MGSHALFKPTAEYELGCGANPRGHKQLVQLGGAGGLIVDLLRRVCNCAADILVRVTARRQARRAGSDSAALPACLQHVAPSLVNWLASTFQRSRKGTHKECNQSKAEI
jgi:hypothetical protein